LAVFDPLSGREKERREEEKDDEIVICSGERKGGGERGRERTQGSFGGKEKKKKGRSGFRCPTTPGEPTETCCKVGAGKVHSNCKKRKRGRKCS